MTYKEDFNRTYGYPKGTAHSLKNISKITGYNLKGLQTIFEKGQGAYFSNPTSVRPSVKSPEQWAMARVYSAVMGGKAAKIDQSHLRFNKKISPYPIMPKHGKGKHGMGFLDDLKEFGLSAAKDVGRELIPIAKDYAISAAKSALTKKGTGLYATPSRGSGYTLSPAQARSLMAGKGVQLKQSMMGGDYEMEMTPAMEKKMAKAFAKGKGMRVGAHNLKGVKKGGFVVPMLMTAARIAAPILIEKLAEAGIKKLGGGKHGGKKGGGPFKKGLFGLDMGSKIQGMGLFAGGGMNDPDGVVTDVIQTGSPYQNTNSPAMNPFIPTRNPFGMYAPH